MSGELVTDLNDIQRFSEARQGEFEALRDALLMDERDDDTLDAVVESLAAPISAAIDCTQCGNCCRTLDVCLVPNDIDRLAAGLLIPLEDVVERYADEALGATQGEWAVIPVKPCPMLKGNLCSIYHHRPHACRIYPQFTPDFRYNMDDVIEGAATCPIIYNTLSALAAVLTVETGDGEAE